ncbi:hypothetical protein PTSG_07653 [Salpingoeca rosetta]|uniref:Uncharacterized protein n=1 Tax=Salpingoeca rosetta (strain ATCC 50818 / BSB-021) TaxID=946362 RepID=F2UHD9_SALR5|nr:uncharacterized protein PTSG_07653 [Salpingoeca rosetta]EGD76538.1 hypothetical protein PTSG_07653 [Salpingoeca rosetta]|eukprot:XP_004991452.1 hypothetical protein PTSG_07653 [Salpingoeca rosetta]
MDIPTPASGGIPTYHAYLDGLVHQTRTLTKPTVHHTVHRASRTSRPADLDLSTIPFMPSMCSGNNMCSGSSDHVFSPRFAASPPNMGNQQKQSSSSSDYSQLYAEHSPSLCLHATEPASPLLPTAPAFSTLKNTAALNSAFGINTDSAPAAPHLRLKSTTDSIFHFDDAFPTTAAHNDAISVSAANPSQNQGNHVRGVDADFLPGFEAGVSASVAELLSHTHADADQVLDAAVESFLSSFSSSSLPQPQRQPSVASSASTLSAMSLSSDDSDCEEPITRQLMPHASSSSTSSTSLSSSSPAHRRKSKRAQYNRSNKGNINSSSSVRAKGTASTMMRGRSAINKRCVLENGEIDHEKLGRTREIARRSYWRRRKRELKSRQGVRQRLTLLNKSKEVLVQKRQQLLNERQALLDHVRQNLPTVLPMDPNGEYSLSPF